jgi:AmmeMemoRadiSam system protein B
MSIKSWNKGSRAILNHHLPSKIIPLLVGEISSSAASSTYAPILAPLLLAPTSLTIVSSDFCHWGRRFNYTYVPPPSISPSLPADAPIHARIAALDAEAIKTIEANDGGDAFRAYLADTGNTVCGRNPILMLLAVLRHRGASSSRVSFVHYSQSSAVTRPDDSSVSYASAVVEL